MSLTDIRIGNVLDELPKIPDASIDLCLTSPPYWGLRDYGIEGQLGIELNEKYAAYAAKRVNDGMRL